MGIKNLLKLIREYAPLAIETIGLDDLRGQRVYIDTSIAVYQWLMIEKRGLMYAPDGACVNHVMGIFRRTSWMLKAGIDPIYVIDGTPPREKIGTLNARHNGGRSTISSRCGKSSSEIYREIGDIATLMGVRVIYAPGEAEAECAILQRGYGGYVATEDMDALAFGAQYMILGFSPTHRGRFTMINRARVLEGLNITDAQFVDLCILMGCDYTGTLKGIGMVRALGYIREYGSIEAIMSALEIHNPEFGYVDARRIFTSPVVSGALTPAGALRGAELCERLVSVYGFSRARVAGTLEGLENLG